MIGCPVKVSIIVPVYNVEKYLSACLTSCLNQTLYDIEIICVNDGSTDSSLNILQKFSEADNRIVIVDKENGGLSSARNAGIKVACGNIIMFLDSDDYLSPTACERIWRETLEAPTDIIIFGTNIFPLVPEPDNWLRRVLTVKTHRYNKFTPKVLFDEPSAKPFVWRQAFAKKLFYENKLFFNEDVKYGEDMVFQLEMFPHAESFAFISDALYNYRWYREGSLMSSLREDIDQRIAQHLSFVEIITEYWEKQGWLELYGKEYMEWLLSFLVVDIKNKAVQKENEHFERLNEILTKYRLKKYLREVAPYFRTFVKMLPKKLKQSQ